MNWWRTALKIILGWHDDFKMKTYKHSDGLHPQVHSKLMLVLEECEKNNLHVRVYSGYRSYEEQQGLYNKGRTKPGDIVTNAKPGHSWHNFGLAFDLVFIDEHGNWSWSEKHDWDKIGEIGEKHGLFWGGNWVNLVDRPHFHAKINISLAKCRELHNLGGVKNVWDNIKVKE